MVTIERHQNVDLLSPKIIQTIVKNKLLNSFMIFVILITIFYIAKELHTYF